MNSVSRKQFISTTDEESRLLGSFASSQLIFPLRMIPVMHYKIQGPVGWIVAYLT